jgi:YD repeat-containing protein
VETLKSLIFRLTVISCLLIAGQAWAQHRPFGFLKKHGKAGEKTSLRSASATKELPVFPLLSGTVVNNLAVQQVERPTTIYREYPSGYYTPNAKYKYECEYDEYGHVTSLKCYEWDGEDYVFRGSAARGYHRLPSGEFVKIKDEGKWLIYSGGDDYETQRYTVAYDEKGMQLWSRKEGYYGTDEFIQAKIENGIRTAICLNGVIDSRYTFDGKGRITRFSEENGYCVSYTWDDSDRITGMVESGTYDSDSDGLADATYTYTYSNIEIAHNEKYFNPYSLDPLYSSEYYYSYAYPAWEGDFSIDDNTLHEVYYNMDATVVEDDATFQAQVRTTVSNNGNRIEQAVNYGTENRSTTVDVLDECGSYRILEDEGNGDTYEYTMTYNAYGELIRNYWKSAWIDEELEECISEGDKVYDRERDAQNRPVKTAYSYISDYYDGYHDESGWEETYETWTPVALPSGIRETLAEAVSVYPNPVAEGIRFAGIDGQADITLSDVSGRVLLRRSIDGRDAVSLSRFPAGIYFINIQLNERELTVKIIKK